VDRSGIILAVTVQPEGEKGRRIDYRESGYGRPGVEHRIKSFSFEDSDHKADIMELAVENSDLGNFDDPVWRKGGLITATWGYLGATKTRAAIITSVKGSLTLAIKAHAKSVLLHSEKKPRTWVAARRSNIAQAIAAEYGYTDPSVLHIEDTGIVYDTIHQAGMTDAALLAKMARQEGFQFYIDATGFHFHRRNLGQKPLRVFHWYADPGQGDVISWDIDNDITARAGSVNAGGRDPLKRADFNAKANNDTTKRQGLAPNPETEGDQYRLDARSGEVSVKRRVVIDQLSSPAPNEAAAKRQADGAFRQTQLGTVKLEADIIGDPLLVAKSVCEWRGLGSRLSGNYYVPWLKETIDGKGYLAKVKFRRDGHSEKGTPASKAQVNKQPGKEGAGNDARLELTRNTGETSWKPGGAASGGPNDLNYTPPQ
jgi:uncharacterized protein